MIGQKGSVLLGSLIMVTLLSMVLIGVDTKNQGGAGFMQVVTSEHSWIHRDYLNASAINLAEAGLDIALDDIAKNWSNGTGYSKTETLDTGSCTVRTAASTSTTYTLEATGTASQAGTTILRKVQLKVKKGSNNDTPHAILTSGNVNFKRASVAIYGAPTIAVHTNGNFQFRGSVGLYAEGGTSYAGVTASGNIQANGSLAASEQTSGAESVPLPSADFDSLKTEATSGGQVINGNYSLTGGTIGCEGITYVKGNLKLEGNVTAKGYLVVEGNVDIKGTLKPALVGQYPEIIVKGNVDIDDQNASSSAHEIGAHFYCTGNFKLRPGSPWLKGSVIADGNLEPTADNAGSIRMDYIANPNSKLTKGTGITPSDWKEVY